MRKVVARGYRRGQSIRPLGKKHGLTYGVTRRLLLEEGVDLRPPGGTNRPGRT